MKKCPFCAEEILDEAIKCKHCGEFLTKQVIPKLEENLKEDEPLNKIRESHGCTMFLSLIIPGLGQLATGRIASSLTFLILAIVLGIPTYGIATIILGIISLCTFAPSYKCPQCKSLVESNALICKHCQTKLK